MRTTLTLDADVAALLEKARPVKGLSFKQIVNEALRAGLSEVEAPGAAPAKVQDAARRPWALSNRQLGRCFGGPCCWRSGSLPVIRFPELRWENPLAD